MKKFAIVLVVGIVVCGVGYFVFVSDAEIQTDIGGVQKSVGKDANKKIVDLESNEQIAIKTKEETMTPEERYQEQRRMAEENEKDMIDRRVSAVKHESRSMPQVQLTPEQLSVEPPPFEGDIDAINAEMLMTQEEFEKMNAELDMEMMLPDTEEIQSQIDMEVMMPSQEKLDELNDKCEMRPDLCDQEEE